MSSLSSFRCLTLLREIIAFWMAILSIKNEKKRGELYRFPITGIIYLGQAVHIQVQRNRTLGKILRTCLTLAPWFRN